jgi:hypothetical protein
MQGIYQIYMARVRYFPEEITNYDIAGITLHIVGIKKTTTIFA